MSADEISCNPPRNTPDETIVVLGIGNVLWADEGFGVRCLEALEREWEFAPHVSLVDGGTQGLYLIHHVQSATKLLIFDAIDYGLPPGTLKLVENEEVPRFLGAKKMSLHQTGFQEVLALAQLTGQYPQQVLLVGCQPEELDDYGGSLRASVKQAMAEALNQGLQRLQAWGAQPQRRAQAQDVASTLSGAMLSMDSYENGRPSPDLACRVGDERFIPKVA